MMVVSCDRSPHSARKVRVNAICPGTVETPSWQGRVRESQDPEQARKDFIARQKMGRLGTAEEIAALVTYLSSDEVSLARGIIFYLRFSVSLHHWD